MVQKFSGWLVAALLAVASMSAQAGFDGRSFTVHYGYPDIDTVYFDAVAPLPSFAVGAGIEAVVEVEGVTDLNIDFSDHSVTILFDTVLAAPTWNWWVPFNGLVFDLTDGAPHGLGSPSIDASTTLGGFGADRVLIDGNRLSFNWVGLSYRDGTGLTVSFAPVPEPGTYALALAGLLLLAGVHWRDRRPARPPLSLI